jgi:hypothetical protein
MKNKKLILILFLILVFTGCQKSLDNPSNPALGNWSLIGIRYPDSGTTIYYDSISFIMNIQNDTLTEYNKAEHCYYINEGGITLEPNRIILADTILNYEINNDSLLISNLKFLKYSGNIPPAYWPDSICISDILNICYICSLGDPPGHPE